MNRQTRSRAHLAAATLPLLATALLAPTRVAHAQNLPPRDTSIDPMLFQPAIGPNNFLTLDGTDVLEHKRLSFGLEFNYQHGAYSIFTEGANPSSTQVVRNQLTGELDAAIGLFGRYQIGIGLPFTPFRKRHGPRRDPVAT